MSILNNFRFIFLIEKAKEKTMITFFSDFSLHFHCKPQGVSLICHVSQLRMVNECSEKDPTLCASLVKDIYIVSSIKF